MPTKKKGNITTPWVPNEKWFGLEPYRDVDPLVPALVQNIGRFLGKSSYWVAYRTRRGIRSFLDFLTSRYPKKDLADRALLERALKAWRDHQYLGPRSKWLATREYISSALRFLKHLKEHGDIPDLRLPSPTWTRPPKPKKKPPRRTRGRRKQAHPLILSCPNPQGRLLPLDFRRLAALGPHAVTIATTFRELCVGMSRTSQSRRRRITINFLRYMAAQHKPFSPMDPNQCTAALWSFREHLYRNREGAEIATRNDDWRALSFILKGFMRLRKFARVQLPEPFIKADKLREMNHSSKNHLGAVIKGVKRVDAEGNSVSSAFDISLFEPDDVFLDHFYRDQRWAFDLLRDAAIREARQSIADFKLGQSLIAQCDIDYLREVYRDTGQLCDPDIIRPGASQPLSFFSTKHPKGLINFLGWVWHEHGGLLKNRSFAGFARVHELGGTERTKRMLGLTTDSAIGFFLVALGETGLNVESLERMVIADEDGRTIFLAPTDNADYARVTAPKPRAGKDIPKLLKAPDDQEINAYACLQAVLEITSRAREGSKLKELWVYPYLTEKNGHPISSCGWKGAFGRFLKRHPELAPLRKRGVTRAMIRGSAGIIEWFESGGNMFKAAAKLGNTPEVAMRRYIPKEIQDVFYRREMRRFQQLLILIATKKSDLAIPAGGYSSRAELERDLRLILNDPDYSGAELVQLLFDKPASKSEPGEPKPRVAFIISANNVALLKLYVDYIRAQKLAHPSLDLDNARTRTPHSFWIELWALIEMNLQNSLDRGLKLRFDEGLVLADRLAENIRFPTLTC